MRIIFDACCLGRRKTGNETYTRGLLRGFAELAPADLDVTVLTTSHHKGERQSSLHWQEIPLGNFATRNFWTIPRLVHAAKPDLYHAGYWVRYWNIDPYVVMIHDISFMTFPVGFKPHEKIVFTRLITQSARRARQVLTVSEYSRHEIHEHMGVPLDQITVTYNGLDDCFVPRSSAPATSSEPPYILYVGNLHPRKNLVRLLEAFVRLKAETKTNATLKIVGQKAWASDDVFETLRRHRLENDVYLTGYIAQDEVVRLYQNATVTVLPSLFEGFGLPVLEAMACGSPVVTSSTTSLPEVAGDAGILVDPLSVEAIAEGLWRVLSSPTLQDSLREKGYLQAKKFTWSGTAQSTLDGYQAALQR